MTDIYIDKFIEMIDTLAAATRDALLAQNWTNFPALSDQVQELYKLREELAQMRNERKPKT